MKEQKTLSLKTGRIVVREEFAKKFFPEISKEYKKAVKKSFDDELEELLKSVEVA